MFKTFVQFLFKIFLERLGGIQKKVLEILEGWEFTFLYKREIPERCGGGGGGAYLTQNYPH